MKQNQKSTMSGFALIAITVMVAVAAWPRVNEIKVDYILPQNDTIVCLNNTPELSREDTIKAMATAFAQQESRFNHQAVSPCGQWVGCLQLSEIMVREANRIAGFECFNYNDRYDRQGSYAIFKIVQEYHNPTLDIDRAIDIWNRHCPTSYRENVKKYFSNNILNYRELENYFEL